MPEPLTIIKSNGEREAFDPEKIRASLLRAGAPKATTDEIVSHIEDELIDGTHTADIYRHAFDLLRHDHIPAAARYSIRRAILEFGPTGFPFEKFIAEIFRAKGYTAVTGQIVKGHCVEHEMDVVAWNDRELIMTEAKFHNVPGIKSDLKVALYIKARFDDLRDATFHFAGKDRFFTEGWLVTNTKFSSAAIKYGECQRLAMIGWNYPKVGNLEDLITEAKIHPLTSLISLSRAERQALLAAGLVLCKDVIARKNELVSLGVNRHNVDKAVAEAIAISNHS